MTRPDSRTRRPPGPRGFTLVELLVVLLILAILVALLIPAIASAIRTARGAAVQAEINSLATAIKEFQNKYGDTFPSRILIREDGLFNTGITAQVPSGATADITQGQLALRTLTAFRKFWPRAAFSTTGPVWGPGSTQGSAQWYDFNGDGVFMGNATLGVPPGPWVLQGHECLVFFLGGIPLRTVDASGNITLSMTGFSKNPTNPFMSSVPTAGTNFSSNRNQPFYEFDSNRLQVTLAGPAGIVPGPYVNAAAVPSLIPGYLDSIASQSTGPNAQNFYAYFSNNNGSGYDPNDFNIDDNRATPFEVLDSVHPLPQQFGTTAAFLASPSPNPYTTSASVGANSGPTFINQQTFQIISPGVDGVYGIGGQYVANGTTPLPPLPGTSQNRQIEADNLTNFHNGKLE